MQGFGSLIDGKALKNMNSWFSKNEIIDNLKLLSEWLKVRHPTESFDLLVIGGAALALMGNKNQTHDIDLLAPNPLPESLLQGIQAVAKVKRIAPAWLNDQAAQIFKAGPDPIFKRFPEYFREVSQSLSIGSNLNIHIIGRQALISLKMYASNPSVRKHIDDLKALHPNKTEIKAAAEFCLANDAHITIKEDLLAVIRELGFDPDDIL
jgi:hypothetical protein